MGNIKQIDIKNRTCYFFNDMINIKDFYSSLLKIDKKSHWIHHNKKIEDYEIILSVNLLYLIINKANGYIECNSTGENNANKYLIFGAIEKKVLAKYTELWDKIKYLIETIDGGKQGEYEKDFMKIEFNSDDYFCLNKTVKFHNLKVIVRSVNIMNKFFKMDVCMSYKC